MLFLGKNHHNQQSGVYWCTCQSFDHFPWTFLLPCGIPWWHRRRMNVPLEYGSRILFVSWFPPKMTSCSAILSISHEVPWFLFDDRVNFRACSEGIWPNTWIIHWIIKFFTEVGPDFRTQPSPNHRSTQVHQLFSFCFFESGAQLAVEKCPPYEQQYWDPFNPQVGGRWRLPIYGRTGKNFNLWTYIVFPR